MSALPSHNTDSVVTDFPKAKGPGARLKAARLVKEFDIAYAAEHLHLSTEIIVALEADDFEHLPARVFIKGYLKNYAKLVELPVEAILKAFDDNVPAEAQAVDVPKVKFEELGGQADNIFKSEYKGDSGSSNIMVWLLLFLAIGGFVAWSKGLISLPAQFLNTDTGPIPVSLIPENKLRLSQPVESTTVLPISNNQESISSVIEVAPITVEKPVIPTSKISLPISKPSVDKVVVETPLTVEVTETTAPAKSVDVVENVKQEIVFTFAEACWVDIRDSSGSFRYVNQVKAGTVKRISGKSPYKILLGNANGASMTINGEPFDLQEYTKANVARFTLDL